MEQAQPVNPNEDEVYDQEPQQDVMSFIVKVWERPIVSGSSKRRWHGYIVQVPTGERLYLHRLGDIVPFIHRHMRPSGCEPHEHPTFFKGMWALWKAYRKKNRSSLEQPDDRSPH
jgi:hypothetical protein